MVWGLRSHGNKFRFCQRFGHLSPEFKGLFSNIWLDWQAAVVSCCLWEGPFVLVELVIFF